MLQQRNESAAACEQIDHKMDDLSGSEILWKKENVPDRDGRDRNDLVKMYASGKGAYI